MAVEVSPLFTEDRVCIRGISDREPIPIYISEAVEIAASDREPVPEGANTWGSPHPLSITEMRDVSSYAFYLPRAPRSYERAGVHVQCPSFDKDGGHKESVSWFTLNGEVEEQPDGAVVHIPMKQVIERVKDVPATTPSKFFGITKTTYVTFTPFCGPIEGQ
jgi:hypothetical protein